MIRKVFILLLLAAASSAASAQDLNARVEILYPQVQNANKRIFDDLEVRIRDFLNNRKWSTDNFQSTERIECSFVINITSWDGSSNYKAEAQIQSSRPVYGTSYNSTILNISDKDFGFSYSEGQPLDYSDQNFINNLSSMLAFYANVIIGMDYDSFSKNGGTTYYAKALSAVNNAQNSAFQGWKAFEGLRNRYWLSENLNNKVYSPIRDVLYEYHRNGLDLIVQSPEKGRKNILDVLPQLQKIDKQKQGSMLAQVFFSAKADELVNILNKAELKQKLQAYDLLLVVDPTNVRKYDLLKSQ